MTRIEVTFRTKAEAELAEDFVNGDIEGNKLVVYPQYQHLRPRAAEAEVDAILRAVRKFRPIAVRVN